MTGPRLRARVLRRPTWPSSLSLAFVVSLVSCAAPHEPAPPAVPMGLLGRPIGTFLRIEGTRAVHGKVGDRTFSVERVDGAPLTPPVELWVENLALPAGERCAISGFETGRWIGLPPEVERAEHLSPHQALWQFQRYFVATSVQAPPALAERFAAAGGRR